MTDFLLYINNHLLVFLISLGLIILTVFTRKIDKKNKKILLFIVISTMLLTVFECIETLFNDSYIKEENLPRYIFSVITYILRPVIIVFFYHIRLNFKNKISYLIWIGAIINAAVYILALFAYHNPDMRFVIWYTDNNIFDRTWLGYTVYVISGLYVFTLIIASVVESSIHKKRRQVDLIIISTAMLAIIMQAMVVALDLTTSYTSEVFIIGAFLYYIYLSFEKARIDAISNERELQSKTTALMLSQIQPHFVYNTLATIQVLCDIDPALASKTIANFSKYLRLNTDALSKTEPVPVLDEIRHATAYSDIEMLRFENVKVSFMIKDTDFKLPVLTIEPMVENAIKYGVRPKPEGKVEVITYKKDKKHYLIIKDNGVGFMIDKLNDGRNHVGIKNVKTRIENMVNGTFNIESIIGVGTTVTITIPEE